MRVFKSGKIRRTEGKIMKYPLKKVRSVRAWDKSQLP